MSARAVLALSALLLGSCGTPVTQLVAVVTTDLDPSTVQSIRVRSLRADADVEEELSSERVFVTPGTEYPVTIAVEPFDLMDIGRVVIEAEALDDAGLRIVAQRATTEFREGEQLALPLAVDQSCRRVMCPANNTCGDMRCRSQDVDAGTLAPFEGVPDAP